MPNEPVIRGLMSRFRKRNKPTLAEMGVAPGPVDMSPQSVVQPEADDDDAIKSPGWTEYVPSNTNSSRTEQVQSDHEPSPVAGAESERLASQMERVLNAMRARDRTRRWMFVKFLLAWLVAYSLVTGELPWFIVRIWDWAYTALVQNGWIAPTFMN